LNKFYDEKAVINKGFADADKRFKKIEDSNPVYGLFDMVEKKILFK
jgi:hypothetical protein